MGTGKIVQGCWSVVDAEFSGALPAIYNALIVMNKKLLVITLVLLGLSSINAHDTSAQSCPARDVYGVRAPLPVDVNLQSQIEVTYFSTDDYNAFMTEHAGLSRSASYQKLTTSQFVAKLDGLQRTGVASIKKKLSATSFFGEVVMINLEREPDNSNARMVNAGRTSRRVGGLSALNRLSEISVFKGHDSDGESYRVSLLSFFVDPKSSRRIADYDAIVLLKPGLTAIFKLTSSEELRRSGPARSYIAITMRSVNNGGLTRR